MKEVKRRIAWVLVLSLLVPMFAGMRSMEVKGESAEPVGTPDVWDGTADTSWYSETSTVVKPTTPTYEITADMLSDLRFFGEKENLMEYTTDPEGRPCMKIDFEPGKSSQYLFFELPEVTDLSDYNRIEIVANVPTIIRLSTFESGFQYFAQWWNDTINDDFVFYNGSYVERDEVGMPAGERGIEIARYDCASRQDKMSKMKYVSISLANEVNSEEDYYIYSLRFLREDYEGETVIPTAAPTAPPAYSEAPSVVPQVTTPPTYSEEPSAVPQVTTPPTYSEEPSAVPQVTTPAPPISPEFSGVFASPESTLTPVSQDGKKAVEKKSKKPVIRLSKGRTSIGAKCVKVRIIKYKGTHVQIYIRQKKKGKFVRIKLKKSSIKKNKKLFKLAYTKRGKTLYCKVRTYRKIKGKKQYSEFSKIKRIRL